VLPRTLPRTIPSSHLAPRILPEPPPLWHVPFTEWYFKSTANYVREEWRIRNEEWCPRSRRCGLLHRALSTPELFPRISADSRHFPHCCSPYEEKHCPYPCTSRSWRKREKIWRKCKRKPPESVGCTHLRKQMTLLGAASRVKHRSYANIEINCDGHLLRWYSVHRTSLGSGYPTTRNKF